MDIRKGVNYWARVGYVSTLTHHRVPDANILILRCNIWQVGSDIPLAMKVYWNRKTYGDKAPVAGDTLLVTAYQQHNHGPMKFKPAGLVENTSTGKDETMATSKNRVRFFIGERYFAMPSGRVMIGKVMARAFGISALAADSWLRNGGVWITCRPSQFARFLIYRNEAGITNGFMDLHAELVKPEFRDFYTRLADITGVERDAVKQVIHALNFSVPDLEKQISAAEEDRTVPAELDVSKNTR